MTVYKKLATARVRLQETDIKKSGYNKFSKFKYFELTDFLPTLNKINLELGLLPIFSMDKDKATLEIVDCDKPEDSIQFEIPFLLSDVKGANGIQNLGGTETYLRRYLFLAAYDISTGDVFDSLDNKDKVIDKEKDNEKLKEKPIEEEKQKLIDEINKTVKLLKVGEKKELTIKLKEVGLPIPKLAVLKEAEIETLTKMLSIIK